jgi:PucR C-terminal helix-turn-helix domain
VVAAQVPGIGRTGLHEIASKLDARDIRSAWRLLPDLQVGIVHLRRPSVRGELIEVLRAAASARVGVSPPYRTSPTPAKRCGFRDWPSRARRPMTSWCGSSTTRRSPSPPVVAPEIMQRISQEVLGRFNDLPADEREILVETFEAWLDAGGSANETATGIYVHPNIVRHRLHRIEERTRKSLSRPRDVAESCLASRSTAGCRNGLPVNSFDSAAIQRPLRAGSRRGQCYRCSPPAHR